MKGFIDNNEIKQIQSVDIRSAPTECLIGYRFALIMILSIISILLAIVCDRIVLSSSSPTTSPMGSVNRVSFGSGLPFDSNMYSEYNQATVSLLSPNPNCATIVALLSSR